MVWGQYRWTPDLTKESSWCILSPGVPMNWLTRLLHRHNGYRQYMTLTALAEHVKIPAGTLRMAVFDRRLEAKKSGHIWLSTPAAVERAIKSGRLRRKA